MPSRIWEPVERLARQLVHGKAILEVLVQHGEIVRVVVTQKLESWTLEDVPKVVE